MTTASKSKITSDRLKVIGVFSFFTIFFWWAFEQAGGSMTIFAADYTDRVLEGDGAMTFKIFITFHLDIIGIPWKKYKLFTFTKEEVEGTDVLYVRLFLSLQILCNILSFECSLKNGIKVLQI